MLSCTARKSYTGRPTHRWMAYTQLFGKFNFLKPMWNSFIVCDHYDNPVVNRVDAGGLLVFPLPVQRPESADGAVFNQ